MYIRMCVRRFAVRIYVPDLSEDMPEDVRTNMPLCMSKYITMCLNIFVRMLISRGCPHAVKTCSLSLSLSLYSSGKQLISVFVVWYFFHQHFHVNSLYRSLDFGALAVACQCHSTAPDFCAYPVKCRSSASSKWHGQSVDETQKGNLCTVFHMMPAFLFH